MNLDLENKLNNLAEVIKKKVDSNLKEKFIDLVNTQTRLNTLNNNAITDLSIRCHELEDENESLREELDKYKKANQFLVDENKDQYNQIIELHNSLSINEVAYHTMRNAILDELDY